MPQNWIQEIVMKTGESLMTRVKLVIAHEDLDIKQEFYEELLKQVH